MSDQPLWSVEAMAQAMHGERGGPPPAGVAGDAFLAIAGDHRDGHDFVAAALAAGAGLAIVAADKVAADKVAADKRAGFPAPSPLLVVADVLAALYDLARAA